MSIEVLSDRIDQSNSDVIPDAKGVNLFRVDKDSGAIFAHYIPSELYTHIESHLDRLGTLAGDQLDELASVSDKNPPVLHVRNRTGENCQIVEKHPAYKEMERLAFSEFGLAAMSHVGGVLGWPEPMHPAAKYAFTYLFAQAEFGVLCPVSMTDSLTRTLCRYGDHELVERFYAGLTALHLDGLTQGAMFMTEKGAGSDVASTAVVAERQPDGTYKLFGDKWFCSNVDADLAMVLARSEPEPGLKGISLFLLPRMKRCGSTNSYSIVRLKDKLGTRSMASGEIRLEGAEAFLVGDRGRGFQQMADMVNNSRLSNAVRSAGIMRRAVTEALFIAAHRKVFGKRLADLPLMRRQLVKMLLAAEQARSVAMLTAVNLDKANKGDEAAAKLTRILTPLIKFRCCRDARKVTGDSMETRGGCGYIEEWSDPRLLRDSHLGSIWEGTSNIVALDVLRAIRKDKVLDALSAYIAQLLDQAELDGENRISIDQTIHRVFEFAQSTAEIHHDSWARQVASALYHAVSVAAFLQEAAVLRLKHRATLARFVLTNKLTPRDPLQGADDLELIDELIEVSLAAI